MTGPDKTEMSTLSRIHGGISDLAGKPVFWALFVALLFSYPVVRSIRAAANLPKPVPVLGSVEPFSLTDQHGRAFGTDNLRGPVWVANFIFTRCPSICPVLTGHMATIQDRVRNLGPYIRLVSFTVDPEYDTPEVLAAYAEKHGASPRMWTFLTGPEDEVTSLVTEGFKIYMGKDEESGHGPDRIGHGSHFVLVDRARRIRGYYDMSEPGAMNRLLRDINLIVNRGD